jgi:hypothetical protein
MQPSEPSDKEILYTRILSLYTERQKYIQEEGVRRLSLWSDWWQEHAKPYYQKNTTFIAACEATITFLEDDYIKRKVDFVTEVYAVLEGKDEERAKRVLGDLAEIFPWLEGEFCRRLEEYVVVYEGLKKVSSGRDSGGWMLMRYRNYRRSEA